MYHIVIMIHFIDLYNRGTYYNPASKHYGGGTVTCDRCNRTNIHSCIGLGNHDICLDCAASIEKTAIYAKSKTQVYTLMEQTQFKPVYPVKPGKGISDYTLHKYMMGELLTKDDEKLTETYPCTTKMVQNPFIPNTRMEQYQFSPSNNGIDTRTSMKRCNYLLNPSNSDYHTTTDMEQEQFRYDESKK
jgi:hypothetical protein